MSDVYDSPAYLALIATIRSAPDDDLPRLMCADWLEERGKAERAEFVRIQCEIADEPKAHDCGRTSPRFFEHERGTSCRRCRWASRQVWLTAREAELHPNGSSATWEVPESLFGSGALRITYSRGFLESLRLRGADWVTHADAILRVNPVRRVTIIGNPPVATFDRGLQIYRLVGRKSSHQFTDYIDGPHYHPDGFIAERLVKLEWPGIAFTFEREAEHPMVTVGRHIDIMAAIDEARVLRGNPNAGEPRGVIDFPDPAEDAEPEPRRRRQSAPPARTRFPRPR